MGGDNNLNATHMKSNSARLKLTNNFMFGCVCSAIVQKQVLVLRCLHLAFIPPPLLQDVKSKNISPWDALAAFFYTLSIFEFSAKRDLNEVLKLQIHKRRTFVPPNQKWNSSKIFEISSTVHQPNGHLRRKEDWRESACLCLHAHLKSSCLIYFCQWYKND